MSTFDFAASVRRSRCVAGMACRKRLPAFPLAGVLLAVAAVGCGEKAPETYQVSGTVLRGGQPVPNVAVNFNPEKGRGSYAVSDTEGNYRLGYTRTVGGALPGRHRVVISMSPARPGSAGPSADVLAILDKYGEEKSNLFVEVNEDPQVIDLTLD